MKNGKLFLAFLILVTSSFSFGSAKIQDVLFKTNKRSGKITIKYTGVLKGYPELKVVGKSVQVLIPDSKVKESIKKFVSFSSSMKDTRLQAHQTGPTSSKIKAIFPFSISKKKEQVALTILDNKIELTFPRVMVKNPKSLGAKKVSKTKVKREFLNEDYLNSLIKMDSPKKKAALAKAGKTKPTSIVSKKVARRGFLEDKKDPMQEDVVKTSLAAPVKGGAKSQVSLIEYGGKFVAFLGVVLLLFYGVITLMKKGFIKKGKLGFLNNTDQVVVLNQTYIAPKKSLMLIKAHKQVFLVSNTDNGIHPISEIKDVAGLFKEGEKAISGHNFDTDVLTSTQDQNIESRVKLKEDITKSNQESSLSDYLEVKDKVKFSDQIKKKVKNLKPLQ